MKSKMLVAILSVLLLTFVSACGDEASGDSGSEGESYTLKLGTALTDGDPIYEGLKDFSESVKERTDGKVTIEIFGSGSLGADNDIIEQAKTGANVAVLVDSGRLADMVPEIGILTAPYIVDNFDEANKVAQSDLFNGWSENLATDHNLQILSFNWYQGERHMLTNEPIETPDDLEGLKIRTMGSPVALATMESLGMSPAGIAWTEVYPALQQGVIDAAEAQHPATYGANLHEVVDYLTKTRHFQLITGIVAGADWMSNLPSDYQKVIYEEAQKQGEIASENTVKSLEEYEQKLIDEGVTVNEVDVAPFKEKTNAVYEEFDGYTELREKINKTLGK
ncbi:C4-dicarboxylate TRAP transporter substrate-binding protein [Virgibacillus salinus]|uniref:Tripartite ATP-independent transporter solute receptor, DctP family n=1 Tax=Virgibacillus salinus TaxID=553311 RepID=A0A1H0YN12_9BACI|nr:C4-dicarboxylate TRAP transporter substrate-binding protein [Virgibacillus salinus]SDQ16549.1 tripartite ATP-independent transporter solute receptor, DctP family [Virgibacillus salinus]